MNHRILFVDDEENILRALKRLLHKSGYETFFAPSGEAALEIIKENELSVIVSDMRMPEMNGVELVRRANEIDSLSVKIILSGYSDIDDIMSAVNGGHIHSYITKPWKEADLMITLMNACEMFERRKNEKNLLSELKSKNEELAELNQNLEKIVQKRTWQINASNLLLNAILKGTEEKELLDQGVRILSRVSGNRPVLFLSEITGNVFAFPTDDERSTPDEKVLRRVREEKKTLFAGNAFYQPLVKREKVLGVLVLSNVESGDTAILGRMESFLSILLLYLSQQDIIGTAPEMIGAIDSLIGEIDGG